MAHWRMVLLTLVVGSMLHPAITQEVREDVSRYIRFGQAITTCHSSKTADAYARMYPGPGRKMTIPWIPLTNCADNLGAWARM